VWRLEQKCFLLVNAVVEFQALGTVLFTSFKKLGRSGDVLDDKFKKRIFFSLLPSITD
jgi:hypothetical protein